MEQSFAEFAVLIKKSNLFELSLRVYGMAFGFNRAKSR